MDKYKLLEKIKNIPNNTRLDEFEKYIKKFEFVFDRQKGSHKIYVRNDIQEFVNIQSRKGKAKPEQISEFVNIVNKYKL